MASKDRLRLASLYNKLDWVAIVRLRDDPR